MRRETNIQVRVMQRLLAATQARVLQWAQTQPDLFEATAGEHRFMILFKYPLLANDDGSDADIAEVHLPGVAFTFYNGTDGFDLTLQILSEGISERRGSYNGFMSRAEAAEGLLGELMAGRNV